MNQSVNHGLAAIMVIGAVVGLAPATAWANAGLPMLVVVWPAAWVGFAPIVLVEAAIWQKALGKGYMKAFSLSLWTNLGTTVIGIPVTWGVLLVYEICAEKILAWLCEIGIVDCKWLNKATMSPIYDMIVRFPWMYAGPDTPYWFYVVAFTILIVFFFFMSWKVEYFMARSMQKDVPLKVLNKAALVANLLSYALLLLGSLVYYVIILNT